MYKRQVIDNCKFLGNGKDSASIASGGVVVSVGQEVLPLSRVVVQNCVSQGNDGDGFVVTDDPEISDVVLKKSEADSNSGIGFSVPGSTVLVASNLSYNNTGGNYDGVNVGNIVTGTTAALPSDPLSLLNFDITQA